MSNINQKVLKDTFDYREGNLYWRKNGKKFGCLDVSTGYSIGVFKKTRMRIHRLIYLYHYGELPEFLDHINRNRSDNRIENLRPATRQQNEFNKVARSNTGYKNICYLKSRDRYEVQFTIENKTVFCKKYKTIEEAIKVANDLRMKLHGEYGNKS